MAASITLIAHTTTNTAASWTLLASGTSGGGTIDDSTGWLAGDAIVLVVHDSSSTGVLASFAPANTTNGRSCSVEGGTSGVQLSDGTAWAPDTSAVDKKSEIS